MDSMAQVDFPFEKRRTIRAVFDEEPISSDGGAVLLRQLDRGLGLTERLAAAVPDGRDQDHVVHSRLEQIRQRIYGIALGYEDCNDASTLRHDPVLKSCCGREPGAAPLASQPSLSRLETSAGPRTCFKLAEALLESYVARHPRPPLRLIIDLDTTDDPTHGQQELSFFNAFYDEHCYLPLLVFDGEGDLLTAVLLPGKPKDAKTMASILKRIVHRLRGSWPKTEFLVRGDSHFAGAAMLRMCHKLDIRFLFGLQPNKVLKEKAVSLAQRARRRFERTSEKVRIFSQQWHRAKQARPSWPRAYHLLIKAEYSALGPNTRFVITDLHGGAEKLYDKYVQRAEACENSIKDLKNVLQADRLSCHRFWANQFRLLLHAAAYVLMFALRRTAQGTELREAQMDTLRLRLLKIAVRVQATVRHVWYHLTSSFPWKELWLTIARRTLQPTYFLATRPKVA